ncbi:FCD domain-containing protein [Saccharospirillum salsuginis]|uniref:Pyruvate dehydrogenase complex repressor n=1 Tax=Saccharospirillum salsuginis TaxID=418750 RepID=A0A918NGF9_9GAMM|nr:FCD domain-containing protein [Saccharospirillum salsuginis]GGX65203.1 transcriptional regulator [Saccharospirillum salsuginis]
MAGVRQQRMSDRVVEELERAIVEGIYPARERLPPERALAAELGVSRPTLREALNKLAVRGLIESRQGGGHRVKASLGSAFSDPLLELLGKHEGFEYDILEYRQALEGMAAGFAAERATQEDRARLTACFERIERAHASGDAGQEAEADAAFHLCIAEASHNVVLLHNMKALFQLLSASIADSIFTFAGQGERGVSLLAQHRALLEGILAGDAAASRSASDHHLGYVAQCLSESRRADERKVRSRRRSGV